MKRNSRLEELLVERALSGLSAAEDDELRALGGADDETFDQAAAAVDLAASALPDEPLPAHLAEKILAGAFARPTVAPTVAVEPRSRVVSLSARAPWLAAAAGIALAIAGWTWALARPPTVVVEREVPSAQPSTSTASAVPTATSLPLAAPVDDRARLLAEAKDAKVVLWKATKDPAARAALGDVVWSASEQRGYMRFVGLEPNDKTQTQYQLWIFDRERDSRYPVDGGVFDISSRGEVVVPITARLRVSDAKLFAVTVEQPGGVVVSKRKRIVVAASPSTG